MLLHVADKDRELGDAHAEIKSLKYSERLKEKAVEEVLQLILAPRVLLISTPFAVISSYEEAGLLYRWTKMIFCHFFEYINTD